jgi:hypothetical protein
MMTTPIALSICAIDLTDESLISGSESPPHKFTVMSRGAHDVDAVET